MFFEVRHTQLCVCVFVCNELKDMQQTVIVLFIFCHWRQQWLTHGHASSLSPSLSLCLTETHAHSHWHTQNHPSSVWKILKALTLLLFGVIECRTTLSHSLIPSLFFSFIPLFAPSLSLNLTSLCTLTLNLRSPALYSHHTSAFSTALSPSRLSLTFNPTSSHVRSLTHTHTHKPHPLVINHDHYELYCSLNITAWMMTSCISAYITANMVFIWCSWSGVKGRQRQNVKETKSPLWLGLVSWTMSEI